MTLLARRGTPTRAWSGVRPVRDNGCWADAGGLPRGCHQRRQETDTVDARGPQAAFLPRALRADEPASRHAWARRHPLILGEKSAHGPRPRTPPPPVPSAAPAHHRLRPGMAGRGDTGPESSACGLRTAGEDRRQTPQRVLAAGRDARCTRKLKDTGRRAPDGGTGSSDGLTVTPDLSSRVTAVQGRVGGPATQRPAGTPPCPGPSRGKTNRPVPARVVVSPERAPARPSDARCRRWGQDTTITVGPYPGGDAPRALLARRVSAASYPSHTTRRSPIAQSGCEAPGRRHTTATGGRAVHSPAVQG